MLSQMASSVGNLADVPADVSPPDPADVPLPRMIQPSVVAADRRAANAAAKLVVALAFAADANITPGVSLFPKTIGLSIDPDEIKTSFARLYHCLLLG